MPMRLAFQRGGKTETAPVVAPTEAALRDQLASLQSQKTGLQAELAAVRQQAKADDNPYSGPIIAAKAADISIAIAHVDGAIAQARVQLAGLPGGQNAGTTQTPPYSGSITPDRAFMGALTLAVPVVVAVSIIMIRRFGRASRPSTGNISEVAGRLERLEQAVDTIAVEVERISEGQRFVTKILSDQPAQMAALAGDPNPNRDKVR